jgi:hypothetical protein
MLNIALSLIDGGAFDMPVTAEQLRRLRAAAIDGIVEWNDFTEITTDDWGAPPVSGRVSGTLNDEHVNFRFGIGNKPKRSGRR